MTAQIEIQPADVHNEQLVANVHPADWKNPIPADRYNLVVIGAGSAGLITAAIAAGAGSGSTCSVVSTNPITVVLVV